MTSVEQEYIDIFHSSRDTINSHSCPIINEQREEAMEKFARIGFPTKKEERYKYTNIQELFSKNYGISFRRAHLNADPYVAYKCDVPNMDTSLIFMINDTFYKNDEYLNLPNGVVISSLSEASEKYPELVKKYYNQLEDKEEDAIRNFNTAFVQDGLFIFVPKNVQVEHPVQLINVLAGKIDIIVNRRILIILEEGAELKLLACDHTHSHNAFLNTQVIEAFVFEQGKNPLFIMLDGLTDVRNFGAIARTAECGAHTFPYMDIHNETAVVEHEATTSKISEDQVFYCNQRGIPTEDAIGLIVNGYAKEVLNKLPMEFAVEAQKLLSVSLEGSVG